MRKAIQLMAESESDIKVIGKARDGLEGVEMVRDLKPDCVTLDIEMPRMNGLEALDIIMRENPTPVLVVSSISTEGAEVTLEALNKGAADFIAKTQSFVAIDITDIKMDLLNKIRTIVKQNKSRPKGYFDVFQRRKERQSSLDNGTGLTTDIQLPAGLKEKHYAMVGIGVSTGGPPVIQHILDNLPADFPAGILIAQHMPEAFTKPFADRLNRTCALEVKEAETGDQISKGSVLIGRGGKHLIVKRRGNQNYVELNVNPADLLYHPSADVLFSSAVEAYGARALGVILTGMGHDGVLGLKELHNRNGTIVAQDEDSCVVYGMPKAVVDAGIADVVIPAADVPAVISNLVE